MTRRVDPGRLLRALEGEGVGPDRTGSPGEGSRIRSARTTYPGDVTAQTAPTDRVSGASMWWRCTSPGSSPRPSARTRSRSASSAPAKRWRDSERNPLSGSTYGVADSPAVGQTSGKLTAKRLRKLRNNPNLQACTGVPIRCRPPLERSSQCRA